MTRRKIEDPYPGYGGRQIPPMLAIGIILILISVGIGTLAIGSRDGGYDEVEKLASIKCLGCLGLDPVVPGFSHFWVEYPPDHDKAGEEVDHPGRVQEVLDTDGVDLLILFFWTQGCVPCKEQWDEMVDEDIASGPEDGGIEGGKYKALRIISVDAAEDPDRFYPTYIPTGIETGVPMTTFIFEDSDGVINWYSHYGRMEIEDLESLVVHVLYHEISSAE
ncbi:MAG: TlpA family protein disulfide reductase [Thermoplasmatota archaeon]